MLNYFFLNLNFNHNFNQSLNFTNILQLKLLFIKQVFSNHIHNSYFNTKHIFITVKNGTKITLRVLDTSTREVTRYKYDEQRSNYLISMIEKKPR
jgi:hypothetical protein